MKLLSLFSLILGFRLAYALDLRAGYKINPEAGLETIESRQIDSAKENFYYRGKNKEYEVAVKGTVLNSLASAKELSEVEYANTLHLYDERGNPYQGQISQLVVCDKKFAPVKKTITINGKAWPTILAGATARQGLGACNADQIAKFALYFNFYDESSRTVYSVRIFTPVNAGAASEISKAKSGLEAFSKKLVLHESVK